MSYGGRNGSRSRTRGMDELAAEPASRPLAGRPPALRARQASHWQAGCRQARVRTGTPTPSSGLPEGLACLRFRTGSEDLPANRRLACQQAAGLQFLGDLRNLPVDQRRKLSLTRKPNLLPDDGAL